jgi:hypothetical protein
MALWIDQFYNTYIGTVSEQTPAYQTGYIITSVFVIPWLILVSPFLSKALILLICYRDGNLFVENIDSSWSFSSS